MSPGRPVVVRLRPGSDGDATHVPPGGVYTRVDPPVLYLEKTAQQWMERRGEARKDSRYILESLPAGYTMWQRPRPSNPKHIDKYLYGHPNHKFFDSPNRFYPHFEYLMKNGGSSIGCDCTVCAGSGGVLPPKTTSGSTRLSNSSSATSSRPSTPKAASNGHKAPMTQLPLSVPAMIAATQQKGRPKLISAGQDTTRVDEEGTPDVYRNLIDKLRRNNAIDEKIEEPLSPDWRAEREVLPSLLKKLSQHEQWIPRHGEIVLYVREMPDSVQFMRRNSTGELQLYDEGSEETRPVPWEAGLITQTPATRTNTTDLIQNADDGENVVYSGVRVEPVPDVNSPINSLSKRYKYVPLRQTCPFVLWKDMLHHVPESDWHPTIKHALTTTATMSLMGKYRFKGTWPNAAIYCHGVYLGFEMLAVGDTVRLLPSSESGQTTCSEIVVIKSIRLKWTDIDKASNNDYDEGRPYNSKIWIYGSAYTSDDTRSNKQWVSEENVEPPKAAADYSSWYPLHPSTKELAIPASRIMGRLYERDAVAFFLKSPPNAPPSLDVGRQGLMEARAYSRSHDQRITQSPNATWYWGDTRAETLHLQTINGFETTKYDRDRDVREARKKLKIMDGGENAKNPVGLAHARDLTRFLAPGTGALPLRSHASTTSGTASETEAGGESAEERGRKRRNAVGVNGSEEDDDEFLLSTKVIEEGKEVVAKKKARVMVVIDD